MVFFFTLNCLPGQSSYLALGGLWCVFSIEDILLRRKKKGLSRGLRSPPPVSHQLRSTLLLLFEKKKADILSVDPSL